MEQFHNKQFNNNGAALIIVIFAMMLFAALGWTLANLQSGDSEINLRNLDSERALGLAEAGVQWALNQLSQDFCWRTSSGAGGSFCGSVDSDCSDSGDWLTTPHSLTSGQYNLCCRNPVSGVESGDAVIEARGYIPSQANYRSRREVKLIVLQGSLANAVMTQPANPDNPQEGLFNWWPARQGHTIQVEGNIYVGHYRGDGDTNDDELGQDYDPPPAPLLPLDIASPQNDARGFSAVYPYIDMLWFYNNAALRWPNPSNRIITALGADVTIEMGGSRILVNINNFFNAGDVQDVIIRRDDVSNWWEGNPGTNWAVITSVTNGPGWSRADVSPAVSTWANGLPIKLIWRIYQNSNNSNEIWYVGGGSGGGSQTDTLIDVRTSNVRLSNKYLICEGDIAVRGANRILVRFTGSSGTPRYPVLGTKNGRIISNEPLETLLPSLDEDDRQERRQISGLIFSESGEVNLNYLQPPDEGSSSFRGNLVYGHIITLDGRITIRYRPNLITSNGFELSTGLLSWNEQ